MTKSDTAGLQILFLAVLTVTGEINVIIEF